MKKTLSAWRVAQSVKSDYTFISRSLGHLGRLGLSAFWSRKGRVLQPIRELCYGPFFFSSLFFFLFASIFPLPSSPPLPLTPYTLNPFPGVSLIGNFGTKLACILNRSMLF